MSAAQVPTRRRFELVAAHTDRASSIICGGVLDARGAPRLSVAIDAALARSSVLVYLDLEDVTLVDATGAGLVAATVRRCAAKRVHLELWPGIAVETMLVDLGVPLPRRAYPSRPCAPSAGPGTAYPAPVSPRHPVWAIPPAVPPASMGP